MKFVYGLIIVGLCGLFGCGSQQSLSSPEIDPEAAAEKAIAAYDTDGDGKISKKEAEVTALDPTAGWDSNGDKAIDQDEIAARLSRYVAMNPGLQLNVTCRVLHKNRPLEGAEVIFELEEFMDGAVCNATGTTDAEGVADMVAEELADPTLPGIHTGLYKVRITHPDKDLLPKYNTETELNVEFSPMDMQTKSPVFKVK